MPKVTESLRAQWARQLSQGREERLEDQAGRPRDAAGIAEEDFNIALMEALLALPLGARFDANEIQARLLAEES